VTTQLERVATALGDRYAIERELGRGGMATVYLAEDLKHHRKVAIKVLKDDVSASVGAVRFLREIEIAAQLQHPHILPLLDSGEAGGVLYYVMPFVEGESLRQRLAREGELPVGEAVRILVEVADALAYAHARGVVHRDIKPDNIMLTGRHAVVADFGVARAVSASVDSGTLTSMGVALGTPAYMAPEQAVADPHVDQRADIYALGVVAYELLAGRTPFAANTPQQMLAAHVTETPDPPSRYRRGLAPALEQALMRCLEKRAADRYQSADDLLAVLEPLATPSGGMAPTTARLAPGPAGGARRSWWIAGGIAAAGFAAVFLWQGSRAGDVTFTLGRSTPVTSEAGLEIFPDLSPDGKFVAYAAGNFTRMRIFIRPVGGGRTIPLSDDSTAVERLPKWSPDGTQILFLTRGGASVAPTLGGTSRPVVPPSATSFVASANWSPEGTRIVFVRGDSLFVMNANGGTPTWLAVGNELHNCSWSPWTDWIACVTMNRDAEEPGRTFGNLAPSGIVLVPASGGEVRRLVELAASNQSPVWSDDGKELYFISNRDGPRDIYAVSVSGSGEARGQVRRLTTGLGAISMSLSRNGTQLAYAEYNARSNIWAVPILANGVAGSDQATAVTSGSQVIESMRVSPDGRWIVYDSNLGGRSHIWRIPIDGGTTEQLTNGPADEFAGDLSPDGRSVTYHSWRSGTRDIEVLPLAGGEAQRVTDTPGQESYPVWSPDGSKLLFYDQNPPSTAFATSRAADGSWSAPVEVEAGVLSPEWSPDGQSIVWADTLAGAVRVAPAAGGPTRTLYSLGDGLPAPEAVLWSPVAGILMKAHDEAGRASFWRIDPDGGRPRLLALLEDLTRPSSRADFAADGQRIYFPVEDRQSDIHVVEVTRP